MRYIGAQQVHQALQYPDLIKGLDRLHREDTQAMEDLLLAEPIGEEEANHLLVRAAWQYGRAVGMKLTTIFPNNPKGPEGLPAVQAVYMMFDGVGGTPQAAVDGTALTYRKTAADSALGARYLARSDAERMLMVGAGAMAPHLIQAHCAARPSIRRVAIWNRSREKAARLATELDVRGVTIEAVEALEEAARRADLISCATMARHPLIRGAWLRPGTHLDLVGAFTPHMRETDDDAFARSTVFVDCRQTTIGVVGEIAIPIHNGTISETDVVADLYDLCRGRHAGRAGDDEITLYKNGGGGHLDLMTARFLLERVRA